MIASGAGRGWIFQLTVEFCTAQSFCTLLSGGQIAGLG
jgi:hypothetical protein